MVKPIISAYFFELPQNVDICWHSPNLTPAKTLIFPDIYQECVKTCKKYYKGKIGDGDSVFAPPRMLRARPSWHECNLCPPRGAAKGGGGGLFSTLPIKMSPCIYCGVLCYPCPIKLSDYKKLFISCPDIIYDIIWVLIKHNILFTIYSLQF